jgi:acetyl-CoA carboxylase carboxyl transferase subunit alpha
MLENTWYTVIAPESCSSILWRNWNHKEDAANALKLTPNDAFEHKFIDGIIEEPLGGAHYEPQVAYDHLKHSILQNIKAFSTFSGKELEKQRQDKFIAMGRFKG